MHFLIINNGTSYIDQIKLLLGDNTFETFYFNDNSLGSDLSRFDAIVLSGGHVLTFGDHKINFKKECDIVLNSNLPIFGICFGMHLIATVYGATLKEMNNLEKGVLKITCDFKDPLFRNITEFEVFENHRIVVTEVSGKLIPLACSKDGIEVVKQKEKIIYGVQFHPEMYVDKTCGDEIFRNFVKLIKK